MPPEIALNRWLTCGCIVSATRKITARCRWRCARCRSLLMSGFPVIFTLPFVWSSRVTLCALVLSIPAPRDWGPCCALWRCWCPPLPPPPPSVRPSVRPALLFSGLKPWKSRRPTSSRPDQRNHNYLCLRLDLSPTHTRTHLITPLLRCPGWISTGNDTHTHTHAAHKHTPLALYSSHHRR